MQPWPDIPAPSPINLVAKKINFSAFDGAPVLSWTWRFQRSSAHLYAEAYTRFLQAQRDHPELNHLGHGPSTDLPEPVAAHIREQVDRDFYRTV